MASKQTVVANMMIHAGTPAKPLTIVPGQSFEIDGEDPENLIGRGIVSPAPSAPRAQPVPSGPVEIPEGWEDLKADELVGLARNLGAARDVTRKDEATAFIAEIVAARAANA